MSVRSIAAAAVVVCAWTPGMARAQHYASRDVPRAGSVEAGVMATWTAGRGLGSANATETSNPDVSPSPLTLFRAESRLKPGVGVEGQIGVYVSRAFEIEGAASYQRPVLAVRVTGDLEGAADTTAEETLTQYLIGGSALYHFGRGRLRPFILGGASYLRQLDATAADAVNGTELHAGGGVKYWFGRRGRRAGLRVDARLSSRDKSVGFDTTKRATQAVVSTGLMVNF